MKSVTERRQGGPNLTTATTVKSSSAEVGKEAVEMAASGVRKISLERDKEREIEEETQPTPPPSSGERGEQEVEAGDADHDTTPPGATPRKARRKNKHSK